MFWHIATGRLALDGALPTTDVFSAADPTAPWHTFQWGYEVLVAALDRVGGLRAVQLLHVALIATAAGTVAALARLRAGAAAPALAATALLMLLFEDRVRARPHVFELLFVVALLPLVTDRARAGAGAALGAVLVMGAWANLHAVSSLWWLALVGAWAVGAADLPALRLRAVTWLGGLTLLLGSPPARDGLLDALRSHSHWPADLVPELRPTLAYAQEGWWGAVVLAGVAAGALAALDGLRRDGPRAEKLVALGCALAAALMARWAWFAAVPLGLALVRAPRPPALVYGLALAAVLALAARVGPRWTLAERLDLLQPGAFPEALCDAMAARGLAPPLDTVPRWSGYALYRLHPPLRVLADGRLLFGPGVAELLLRREAGDAATFDEAALRFGTRALLWPTDQAPPLDPARWTVALSDPVATLWVFNPEGSSAAPGGSDRPR